MQDFRQSMYQLIVETATRLPDDVRATLGAARAREAAGTRAALALSTIAQNIQMADDLVAPICQDTGMPTFEVHCPVGTNQIQMAAAIREAIKQATQDGKLRPNSVDSLTGHNSGDNLGPGTPVMHFSQWEQPHIEVKLILKGGGCENKNIQYSLPADLGPLGKAGRDLDGVRKCILHSVWQAQGQGCSAGFIGVSIGGDRTTGYAQAKEQLFRRLDDTNPHPALAELENYILKHANDLGIGTMGFGGEVTLLGCKIGMQNRLPASFFVSVAYNCWAYRRQGVDIDPSTGRIQAWHYQNPTQTPVKQLEAGGSLLTGNEVVLQAPISEAQIRQLKVGDVVVIQGAMHTGRDALHKYLMDHPSPVDLTGGVLYHCGPVVLTNPDGSYRITAAGPTTSIREEPYQADIIDKFGLRVIIGKGGMGKKTLNGLKKSGAVYLNAIGGAAQYYAQCIQRVDGVHFLEFGIPEAMWHLTVDGFAAIVTMDSHGNSLHQDVETTSEARLAQLAGPVF